MYEPRQLGVLVFGLGDRTLLVGYLSLVLSFIITLRARGRETNRGLFYWLHSLDCFLFNPPPLSTLPFPHIIIPSF